jgi:signal transduction histidine kinase
MQKKPASKPKQTQAELRKQLVTASKKLEQFQREQKIEAALDSVRSRALAMRESSELREVVAVLYQKLQELEFGIDQGAALVMTFTPDSNDHTQWITDASQSYTIPFFIPFTRHSISRDQINARKKGLSFLGKIYNQKEKNEYFKHLFQHTEYKHLPRNVQKLILNSKKFGISIAFEKHAAIAIPSTFGTLVTADEKIILKRFAKVFEQCYTRFLDLQKAEAQAREAQIEAALEKVRSRSHAMRQSHELSDIVLTVYNRLNDLGFNLSDGAVAILEFEAGSRNHTQWIVDPYHTYPTPFKVPYTDHALCSEIFKARAKGVEYLSRLFTFGEKNDYFKFLFAHNPDYQALPKDVKKFLLSSKKYGISVAFSKHSAILIPTNTGTLLSDEKKDILIRFSKVFDQAYTRFLDLQKAEAQVREAQIEAALERVRSRSMAMHKSEELLSVITVVSEQLQHLNFKFNTVSFAINNQAHDYTFWFAIMGDPNPIYIQVPYIENPMFDRLKDIQARGADFYTDTLTPEESKQWHEHVFTYADIPSMNEETRAYILRSGYARSIAIRPSIMLVVSNYAGQPYSEDQNEIIRRFATVFEQSYTRFLDLQRAEAQTREAQIEAALERVRSRTMAMHKSSELIETAELLFDQLNLLGAQTQGVAFAICDKESTIVQKWTSIGVFSVPYTYEPGEQRMYEAWKNQLEIYEEVYEGERLKEYYDLFMQIPEFREGIQKFIDSGYPIPTWQKNHTLPFKYGYLLLITTKPFEETQIFIRFAKVFEQTYTRFLDLQKAEAQAKEAIKQSSLDRVRGEIASMRTTADLDRITPLIWRELTTLSIPFSRCGVFIMDEAENQIHTFLSTPDGDAIAAFKLPMDNPGNLEGAVEHWRHHHVYVTHWVDQDFQAQADLLMQLGAITSRNQYLSKVPDGGIYLHLLPFMHGMLYVGNTAPLSEDELNLVQSLADAFSVAYARYEDFRQLELAKKEVDKAFTELKQAQQQLVQSEKMASLGELTAGIAHEIQNPLNFVNNFSEVSNELIKEIQDLRQKTHEVNQDTEEDMLLKDIASNLEKINFHGKRADAIVKSMLQHSRTSSGKKELTNINVLCDEYLRLAYHGYRAKDKSFNAKFESQLDPSLPKVNVMAQDIGRVVLNLINNAFYAVNAKARLQAEGFMPQVTVVTRKLDSTIEISVKDNGNGIPDSIKEKIFQPFFTTKPTGQGTGLGLSLAYDIVTKGHGGELRVETEEGKGTAFIINLPVL